MNDIIYNITFFVDDAAMEAFVPFLRAEFLPAASRAGLSLGHIALVRSQGKGGDEAPNSFAVQFRCGADAVLDGFRNGAQSILFDRLRTRFGERVLPFATVMDILFEPSDDGKDA